MPTVELRTEMNMENNISDPPPTSNPTPGDSLSFKWEAATEDDLQYLALNPSPNTEADQEKELGGFLFIKS